ncbi:MAG: ERCC4 domain-containing protein [Candidatus Pacearchaeota archaeon]
MPKSKKPILDIFSSKKKKSSSEKKQKKENAIVDFRERSSLVPEMLEREEFEIEYKELKVADYIVKDVAIERKTIQDFISSMINQRLLRQLEELQQYENNLLILEGIEEQDIYGEDEISGLHPNSIRGFILSITLKYKVPIVYSKNSEDTAKYMSLIAKKQKKETRLNPQKKTLDKNEQLQFIIEAFPGIGPKKARELLEKFGNIQRTINATEEELREILGKKAEEVIEIINREYKEEETKNQV